MTSSRFGRSSGRSSSTTAAAGAAHCKHGGHNARPPTDRSRGRRGGLVKTLRPCAAAGASASEAADRLFLHRNSMTYRLERVSKLTGLDLRDPGVALALQLGLLSLQ